MTYSEARIRIGIYWSLAWVLRIGTALILFTVFAKAIYGLSAELGCGRPCYVIQDNIADLFNSNIWMLIIWNWLPNVSPELWYLQLVSSAGLCAGFFMFFTFLLDRWRRDLSAVLKEAVFRMRVARFNQSSNSQLVSAIQAGGHVSIEQTINHPDIADWDRSFAKSPIGQIIIAASGGFLAFLLGKLFGG
jgi:hypothetical protein